MSFYLQIESSTKKSRCIQYRKNANRADDRRVKQNFKNVFLQRNVTKNNIKKLLYGKIAVGSISVALVLKAPCWVLYKPGLSSAHDFSSKDAFDHWLKTGVP
jgi:hypothetical protein